MLQVKALKPYSYSYFDSEPDQSQEGMLPRLQSRFLCNQKIARTKLQRFKTRKETTEHHSQNHEEVKKNVPLVVRKSVQLSIGMKQMAKYLQESNALVINNQDSTQDQLEPSRIHTLCEHQIGKYRKSSCSRNKKIKRTKTLPETLESHEQEIPLFRIKMADLSQKKNLLRLSIKATNRQLRPKKRVQLKIGVNDIEALHLEVSDVCLRRTREINWNKKHCSFFPAENNQSLGFLIDKKNPVSSQPQSPSCFDQIQSNLIQVSQGPQWEDNPLRQRSISPWR